MRLFEKKKNYFPNFSYIGCPYEDNFMGFIKKISQN